MGRGIMGKNHWALFLLLLAGIVLGGFIGNLAAGVPGFGVAKLRAELWTDKSDRSGPWNHGAHICAVY